MTRCDHRGAAVAVLLACSSATMGCVESDSESEFEPDGARSVETAGVESTQPATADSLAAGADPDSVGTPEALRDAPAPTPTPTPTAVRRAPTRAPARAASVAAIVHGIAELQIDEKQFVPADYLRAALRGGAPVQETLTSAGGEFFFENVPAGRYQLVFLTVTKDARQVYATTVRVEAGDRVRLPPVHIPIDSVRSRRY